MEDVKGVVHQAKNLFSFEKLFGDIFRMEAQGVGGRYGGGKDHGLVEELGAKGKQRILFWLHGGMMDKIVAYWTCMLW